MITFINEPIEPTLRLNIKKMYFYAKTNELSDYEYIHLIENPEVVLEWQCRMHFGQT